MASRSSAAVVDEDQWTALKDRLVQAGQGHVLDLAESATERTALYHQVASMDLEVVQKALASAMQQSQAPQNDEEEQITPFQGRVASLSSSEDSSKLAQSCWNIGLSAIQQGKVAALVLAGGQGTRLGFAGPKGMYDIGLPSHRSLFQLLTEKLVRLGSLAGGGKECNILLYIMTSPLNHQETMDYFAANNYFGLGKDNVVFFPQGLLPCFSTDGKIIMESPSQMAMAPDGNGGIYPSLQKTGALADMQRRGIEYLHVFSIDNALVKPADPVFVGYCIQEQADCGNKVVWKAHAHEKVGVIAARKGQSCVVEYSEISTEMAEQCDAQGRLQFGAANICNHFYTLDFLVTKVLPNMGDYYHVAHKKIPYYDAEQKTTITPTANNGIKLETFIFDIFPLSGRMAILDVPRDQEFAPVKNKPGSAADCPDTARAMISELAKRWVRQAGGKLVDGDGTCEIAPTTSYAGEGLESLVQGKEIVCPFSL